MKALYLDCFAGISGNMLLGAFLDSGVPESCLREALDTLDLTGYQLVVKRVMKNGISATYADVVLTHHHHHHRHLPDIYAIIDRSALEETVKDGSRQVFRRLAEAEAKVHGTTIDKIHFHEVGAIDSIIDIVGTVYCLHYLKIQRVFASSLQVGNGFVRCSHGSMPVPAPATAELLQGMPWYSGTSGKELVTPTGAAVLAIFGSGFGDMPSAFRSHKIGYGAGGWDLEFPNVLRMHIGEYEEDKDGSLEVVEANIDDQNPQVYSYIMDKLLASGALDVWMTPIIMKKSRPAVTLSLLCHADKLPELTTILFSESTTIGIRHYTVDRTVAERSIEQVSTTWGMINVKVSRYQGKICSMTPEYEDCCLVAAKSGLPLKHIQQLVMQKIQQISEYGH